MSEAAELRAELAELFEGNKELRATVSAKTFAYALRDAGFDPDSPSGRAIARTYDPDEPVTPDAVAAYAQGLGFSPEPAMSPEELAAHMRSEGEQRLSMVVRGAMPSREPSADDKVNQAIAEGDLAAAGRLNAQKLQRLRQQPQYGGR